MFWSNESTANPSARDRAEPPDSGSVLEICMHQARYLLLGACLFGCATPPAQSPAISRLILHLQTRDRVDAGVLIQEGLVP